MKPDTYLWIALPILLYSLGGKVLIDSVRHSGPYAEEYMLLGATVAAMGLAALFFAFKQRAQLNALAQHMGRGSRFFKGSMRRKIETNS